jgi:sirohydrochlorin cobaltochelatase
VETFLDRLKEMLVGQNLMNCALCKYREQVLGFEAEVGLAQESHHHHVEGIGGGLENCPCTGDCDGSCRDEAFCKAHGLPWTPLHGHDHDHGHDHAHVHHHGDGHWHTHEHGPTQPHALSAGQAPVVSLERVSSDHHHHPYPHADHPLGPRTLPEVAGRLARRERGA